MGGGVRDVNEGGESTLARSGPGRVSLRWTGGIFYARTCIDGKFHSRPCIDTLLRSGPGTLDLSALLPAQGYLQVSRQSGNEKIALLPSQRNALKLKKMPADNFSAQSPFLLAMLLPGYMELFGIPPGVKAQLYKLASISLCSNTIGQVVTGLMVHPPEEGSPSFPTYEGERTATLTSLRRRAQKLTAGLGNLEGVSVQPSTGAMYSFPRLSLPPAFHAEAVKQGTKADELYCIRLVEATGIVVVPGSGFGQVDGSWHFRTTFLPPEDKMDSVMERLGKFHKELLDAYRG